MASLSEIRIMESILYDDIQDDNVDYVSLL